MGIGQIRVPEGPHDWSFLASTYPLLVFGGSHLVTGLSPYVFPVR